MLIISSNDNIYDQSELSRGGPFWANNRIGQVIGLI